MHQSHLDQRLDRLVVQDDTIHHQPVMAHVPVGGAALGAPQCILGNGTTTFTYESAKKTAASATRRVTAIEAISSP